MDKSEKLYCLAIDTATQMTKISLRQDAREIDCLSWQSRFNQSQELISQIDEFLSKNSINKTQIRSIGVGMGPGSYTGIRIGVTTANLLGFALNIPVVAIEEIDTVQDTCYFGPVLPIYQGEPHITTAKL
ncbi:MAG: tRNA (adenosine(37)-N6)-threonylcarbamoyltransferase complex dimerization subunit type 1 TsaB [bacterium]